MASQNKIIKIAITGPESSGKTFTTEYLARAFDGWMVPEYGREYLQHLDREYSYDDVLNIAKGQIDVEQKVTAEAIAEDAGIVFFDTELINTKIWCDEVFKKCERFIIDGIADADYDHYLLMRPDIDWEPDPLRENQHDRDRLFDLYLHFLNEHKKSFTVIEGSFEERLKKAVAVVRTFGITQ
jgi:NadR type nicotinamide-nucleotide adenylyltransferase